MNYQLRRIGIMKTALFFCFLHVLVGLAAGGIVAVNSLLDPDAESLFRLGAWAVAVFPLMNAVIGFAAGALIAWMYNTFAGKFGGVVLELEEV
ncbi:MAG: hypothetical protein HQL22_07280 [Candidatus Omnitrophica bacterium]|nr:hypothetical protein [Candidatus Omnitrophota bacterium]